MKKSIYGFSYFPRYRRERSDFKEVEYKNNVSNFDAFMFGLSLVLGVVAIADYTFKLNLFN